MPIQVTFRNMRGSPELEQDIRARAARLVNFDARIVACRVLVDVPHRHHQHGNHVHVRIELSIPGEDVVVSSEPGDKTAAVAIHDAFDVARRRLEDAVRKQRSASP